MPGDTRRLARFALERLRAILARGRDTDLSAEISELIGTDALSVSSLPLLGMGRDIPDGLLWLRGNRLDLSWTTATSEAYFERVLATMRRDRGRARRPVRGQPDVAAQADHHRASGRRRPDGTRPQRRGVRLVRRGVRAPGALHRGRRGDAGAGRHQPVADDRRAGRPHVHPAAGAAAGQTARAPAGRSAADRGGSPIAPARRHRRSTSLSFTEEMTGTCTPWPRAPVAPGSAARGQPEPLAFRLTITADDVERFLDDPEHTARAEGWIDAASLGGRRQVQRGWFNLFAPDGAPDRRLMRYRLQFADAAGQPRTLTGQKDIFHGPPTRIWPDTSTLHFRLLDGHVAEGEDDAGPRPRDGHPAPEPDRLRAAAHHHPGRGTARGGRPRALRPVLLRPALGRLRTSAHQRLTGVPEAGGEDLGEQDGVAAWGGRPG